MRHLSSALALSAIAVLIPAAGAGPHLSVQALAPIDVVADGFRSLQGVVIDRAGRVFLTDRDAGTVTRLAPDGPRVTVARGLRRPVGIALDADDRVLIVEEKAGRVTRVEASGRRITLIRGLERPRWLAARADGTIFVSAHRLGRDPRPQPDEDDADGEMVLALRPSLELGVLADGFRGIDGLALADDAVLVAATGRRGARHAKHGVFRIPVHPDGTAGPVELLGVPDILVDPGGVAVDSRGAVYVIAQDLQVGRPDVERGIGKLHPDGHVSVFASKLDDPRALAFDSAGNLYATDGTSGRLLRFRAPPPPSLRELPPFTSQAAIVIVGTAEAGARVEAMPREIGPANGVVAAASGAFSLPVQLPVDTESRLAVVATSHAGDGLASAPAVSTVTHDSLAPALTLVTPQVGAFVRSEVRVEAVARDDGSHVSTLTITAAGRPLVAALAPAAPAAWLTATATWDTRSLTDGAYTVAAVAGDLAGNATTLGRSVIVDNTPPETAVSVATAPPGAGDSLTVDLSGTDNLTPSQALVFSYRVDDGPWSAFSAATRITLNGLSPGSHRLEAKARDQAGNEDPTPAQATASLAVPGVTIEEPISGAIVAEGMLLVRGTVSGGAQIGVIVNRIRAAVADGTFIVQIPVTAATTTIMAVATLPSGVAATHAVDVTVVSGGQTPLVLRATPTMGAAPLVVTFTVSNVSADATIELDLDGDGVVDFSGPSLENQRFVYPRSGAYVPALTVTDAAGARTVARAVVHVLDPAQLDALLQAQWTALRSALLADDVDRALQVLARSSREPYRSALDALAAAGALRTVGSELGPITPMRVLDGAAEYDLRATRGGIEYSFHVLFVVDEDGLWRLWAL